jgi:iron-sulfur cluster assembly accessory protein
VATQAFQVTAGAAEHILASMKKEGAEGQGLRVAVVTGGCSGYEYALRFAPTPDTGDQVIEVGDLRVFIDPDSLDKLSGTVLDYARSQYGGGLKFTNPKAVHTCGCGTSFSTE